MSNSWREYRLFDAKGNTIGLMHPSHPRGLWTMVVYPDSPDSESRTLFITEDEALAQWLGMAETAGVGWLKCVRWLSASAPVVIRDRTLSAEERARVAGILADIEEEEGDD